MKKILLASCVALKCILPQQGLGKELKWSDVIQIKGAGVTNCGKNRITNEAWDKCEEWAKSVAGAVIKDVELYNIATENDKGTSWDPKLKCSFHANVKCGYAVEDGKPKLKLSGRLKQAGAAPAADCSAASADGSSELAVSSKCEDAAAEKKAPQRKTVKKAASLAVASPPPSAAIQSSKLLRIKGSNLPSCGIDQISSEVWRKCKIWAAKQKAAGGRPELHNVELHQFAMKPLDQGGCSYEAAVKCLHTDSRPTAAPPAVAVKDKAAAPAPAAVGKTESAAPLKKKADFQEFVDSKGMRWSPLLDIEGAGITNCGENRVKNEAWDKCETWTAEKKPSGGRRAVLKDVELYNIASENHQGPSWAPKQSCTFHATLKCGYKME